MSLTRDQILAACDVPVEEVECPEWGGSVFVKVMSGTARDHWEMLQSGDKWGNPRARLCAMTVCDAEGQNLFTLADIAALGAKSSAVLDRLFDVALRLNRLRKQDIEELEKNSEADPSENSHSASRFLSG